MLIVSVFSFVWTSEAWSFRILGKTPCSNKSSIIKLKEFGKMSVVPLTDALSESTVWGCLNVKELLARNRCDIWRLSDFNGTRTHNHLVRKRTINHLVVNSLIVNSLAKFRSSRPDVFCKKGVLRSFTKFTEKQLRQSLFFNKVAGLSSATLLKKRLWHRCFPVNFAKFLRTHFSQNTSERLLLNMKSL